ncbi:MAG: Cof-type HAD-IIB family hydrolase [Coriobacteriales bacterium]|jgi:Cof subfamily protein (haloacid dehalogenase superfamily)|nr:Cof-type HAD-IIB family hydrolase [Coriobacteriales bacterium]
MIKLIVSDLDNTLLNSSSQVSSYTGEVIARCQSEGYVFALATARARRATRDFALSSPVAAQRARSGVRNIRSEVLGAEIFPDYRITNNGATVWAADALVSSLNIPGEIVSQLMERFLATPQVSHIMVEYGDTCMTTVDESLWVPPYEIVRTDFLSFETFDTPKLSIECEDWEIAHSLLEGLPQVRMYSNQGVPWHQVVSSKVDKGFGLQRVAEDLGVSPQEIVCFGDDVNDLPMLGSCATFVAVSNAVGQVKERATHVCDSNQEDGVAKWMEENLLTSQY